MSSNCSHDLQGFFDVPSCVFLFSHVLNFLFVVIAHALTRSDCPQRDLANRIKPASEFANRIKPASELATDDVRSQSELARAIV